MYNSPENRPPCEPQHPKREPQAADAKPPKRRVKLTTGQKLLRARVAQAVINRAALIRSSCGLPELPEHMLMGGKPKHSDRLNPNGSRQPRQRTATCQLPTHHADDGSPRWTVYAKRSHGSGRQPPRINAGARHRLAQGYPAYTHTADLAPTSPALIAHNQIIGRANKGKGRPSRQVLKNRILGVVVSIPIENDNQNQTGG